MGTFLQTFSQMQLCCTSSGEPSRAAFQCSSLAWRLSFTYLRCGQRLGHAAATTNLSAGQRAAGLPALPPAAQGTLSWSTQGPTFVSMFMSLCFPWVSDPTSGQGEGGGVLRGLRGARDDDVHDSVGVSFSPPGSLSHYADARLPTPNGPVGLATLADAPPAWHLPLHFSTCIHGGE